MDQKLHIWVKGQGKTKCMMKYKAEWESNLKIVNKRYLYVKKLQKP